MERVSRPGAVSLFAAAIASTAAGLWLHAAGGRVTPAGFLQYAVLAVGTGALGTFILWHRPRNRYGLTHLAIGVLFGTVVLAAGVLSRGGTAGAGPDWTEEVALAWSWISAAALLPLGVIAVAPFPDGKFHRAAVK